MSVVPRHAKGTARGWTVHTLTGHNDVSNPSFSAETVVYTKPIFFFFITRMQCLQENQVVLYNLAGF